MLSLSDGDDLPGAKQDDAVAFRATHATEPDAVSALRAAFSGEGLACAVIVGAHARDERTGRAAGQGERRRRAAFPRR